MCRWCRRVWLTIPAVNSVVKAGLTEKGLSEPRLEAGEGVSQKEEGTVEAKFLKLSLFKEEQEGLLT